MTQKTPEQRAAHAAYERAWRARNRERHRATQARYYAKHKSPRVSRWRGDNSSPTCVTCGAARKRTAHGKYGAGRNLCWPCYRRVLMRRYLAGDPPPVQLDDHVAARLWSKIERRESDACWPWHGATAGRGKVPALRLGGTCHGRKESAVRLLYAMHYGITPPPGSHVVRRCGGLRCMNPTHFVMLRASGAGIPPAVRERLGMLPLTEHT